MEKCRTNQVCWGEMSTLLEFQLRTYPSDWCKVYSNPYFYTKSKMVIDTHSKYWQLNWSQCFAWLTLLKLGGKYRGMAQEVIDGDKLVLGHQAKDDKKQKQASHKQWDTWDKVN